MDDAPDGFDLDTLLSPIGPGLPAGPDLREDYGPQSLYYRLRDARSEARAAERAMDSSGEAGPAPPQWGMVRSLAAQALAVSKDLEIAGWYTEALLRSHGLPGFTAGARLMDGLAREFWDGLYPLPDEDGLATRVAPVTGLNGQGGEGALIQPLRKLALFMRPSGEPLPLWQYDQAAQLLGEGDPARRQARLAAGVLAFDDLENEARAAGGAHFTRLRRDAAAALAAWQSLSEALDARAGTDSPPTSQVRDVLLQIEAVAVKYAPSDAAEKPAPGVATMDPPGLSPAAISGLGTREDALQTLSELARFFRATEPHSPLAYTLDEAVRRGRMSWPELLAEIVPDAATRNPILASLGIRPPPEPG